MVHNTFADIYYKPDNSALEKCDYDDYVFKKCTVHIIFPYPKEIATDFSPAFFLQLKLMFRLSTSRGQQKIDDCT